MNQRVEKLRKQIQQHHLDAFLISSLTNIKYLFGFTGSNAIALITSDLSFFITDRRYTQQSKLQVVNAEILIAKKDLYSEIKNIKLTGAGVKLGVESMHMTVKDFFYLKKSIPGVKLIASERIVEKIASIKDCEEIEHLRKAAVICQAVFNEVVALIKPGIQELDISAELSYRLKRHGSEKDPFEPIVASGKRSALPHGISSSKQFEDGDLIIMDFGATVNGYAADFTRTVVIGEASKKQREMGSVVVQALEISEASARPGMSGKQLDKVARDLLQRKGYARYFQHSLGHGLGLSVHELPRIGELSNDPLEAGNVITLEPGVYIPDIGGVRIEDDFVVTNEGVENLTPLPREVMSVG